MLRGLQRTQAAMRPMAASAATPPTLLITRQPGVIIPHRADQHLHVGIRQEADGRRDAGGRSLRSESGFKLQGSSLVLAFCSAWLAGPKQIVINSIHPRLRRSIARKLMT
jgi:hypothetical protein